MASPGSFRAPELRISTPQALSSFALVVALGIIICRALYNHFLHPLARFPGPSIRSAFGLVDAISTLKGTQYRELQRLHLEYGHVVRIAPNSLSYSSPQAWDDIYALKSDRSELGKDPSYYKRGIAAQILTADQAEHARMRKVLAPFFSDGSLIEHETMLNSYFDLFVVKLKEQIDDGADGHVDLMAYFNFVTFDIIGELVLGSAFGALKSGKYHTWIRNVFESIKVLGVLRFASNYRIVGMALALLQCIIPSLGAKREAHMKFTEEKVKDRLILPAAKRDLIAQISKHAHSDDGGIAPNEILTNCRVLLTAGSETTATHLTGVTWFLMMHTEKLRRLQHEIRTAFPTTDEITFHTLRQTERLPYLNAVIQEGLRCYPSVPSILPRVTNTAGNMIAGQYVPGGVSVGVHHWSAYRHPDNFHKPNDFIPERWLADAPSCFDHDARHVLQPFHVGPRGCLGKSLAWYEIRALLVRLLWHFDVEIDAVSLDWFAMQKEYALWDKPSLWAKISHRRAD